MGVLSCLSEFLTKPCGGDAGSDKAHNGADPHRHRRLVDRARHPTRSAPASQAAGSVPAPAPALPAPRQAERCRRLRLRLGHGASWGSHRHAAAVASVGCFWLSVHPRRWLRKRSWANTLLPGLWDDMTRHQAARRAEGARLQFDHAPKVLTPSRMCIGERCASRRNDTKDLSGNPAAADRCASFQLLKQ